MKNNFGTKTSCNTMTKVKFKDCFVRFGRCEQHFCNIIAFIRKLGKNDAWLPRFPANHVFPAHCAKSL